MQAYPDMSEIGNFHGPDPLRTDEERTHWGLWVVQSAPLILGLDKAQKPTDGVAVAVNNTSAMLLDEQLAMHIKVNTDSFGTKVKKLQHDAVTAKIQSEVDGQVIQFLLGQAQIVEKIRIARLKNKGTAGGIAGGREIIAVEKRQAQVIPPGRLITVDRDGLPQGLASTRDIPALHQGHTQQV